MKKILLALFVLLIITLTVEVNAIEMICFNDSTLCVANDDVNMTSNEDIGTLISRGDSYIKFKDAIFNDVNIQESMSLELAGESTVNYFFINGADLTVNILGDGTLKAQEISIYLGGAEIVYMADYPNLENMRDYLPGEYTITTSGEYIVLTGTKAVEQEVIETPTLVVEANDNGSVNVVPTVTTDLNCQIYRATLKTGKYTKVATIDDCTQGYVDEKTLPGKTYYYKVRAYKEDVEGNIYSSYSDIVSKKAVLSAPVSTVESVNKTTLLVDWEPVEGATKYQVYRATSKNGKYTLVKTTTATSYKNTKLTTGKRYYYKVRAYKEVGTSKGYSSYSEIVSDVPKVGVATYSAQNNGYNSVKITIDKVSGASGYSIYRSLFEEGPYELVTRTTKTTYIDKKLTTGNTYYYKIKAYTTVSGSKKYGNYGDIVSASPLPTAPNFTINNKLSAGYLKIEIEKVAGATGYDIYRHKDGNDVYLASTSDLTYIDDNVTLGQEYSYRVVAHRAENMGAFLGEFSDVQTATVKPEVPTLTIKNDQYNSNVITVNLNEGIYADEGYKFYLYRNSSKTGEYDLIYEGTDFEYTDTDLSFNKTYYYKVVLERQGIQSEESDIYSKKTALPKPEISAKYGSKSSIKITIDKVEGATGYEIYRATSKTGKYSKIKTTAATSYTNTSLTAGKTYYYKVRAYKTVNGKKVYSSYSAVVSEKPRVGIPAYTLSTHTYNSNKIIIDKVSGASGYAIYRSNDEDGKYSLLTTTTKTTYTDKNLNTGTTYYYKVRAYSLVGKSKKYGDYSDIQSATPYLESPEITFAKENSMSSITLNYNKISGAHGYEIYKLLPDNLEPIMVIDTKELTYTDTEVTLGELYTYFVRAYREVDGNKVYSFEDKYNTKEVIPATPIVNVTNESETTQLVTVSLKEYDSSMSTIVIVHRKTNDGEYELVYEDTPNAIDSEGNVFVEFYSEDLVVGNTYTYKAYVLINNIKSDDSSEVAKTSAYTAGKLDFMINSVNLNQIEAYLDVNDIEIGGMELYSSPTIDGEYELVTEANVNYAHYDAYWNKTYYYKARYYQLVDGVKIYSEYSEPVKYRPSLVPVFDYPYEHVEDNYNITLKSMTFKLVETDGEKFELKATLKVDSYSTKARTIKVQIGCVPSMGDANTKVYYLDYTFEIPKGSKTGLSKSDTVTIPKHYSHYWIESIEEV